MGRRGHPSAPSGFDPADIGRIEARLAALFLLARRGRLAGLARVAADRLATELEELDVAPTRPAAEDLLDALESMRAVAIEAETQEGPAVRASSAALMNLAEAGGFVCHRPGRSLATGEAEIASRGYFDERDRPPIASWLGLLDATSDGVDRDGWIVAWVEPEAVERARVGARACPSGALAWIDDLSAPAADRLRASALAALRAS